jgi:hypothetical protein
MVAGDRRRDVVSGRVAAARRWKTCNTFKLEEQLMSGKIKIRCNGQENHVNEIDLERLLESTFVTKSLDQVSRLPDLDDVEFPFYEDCRYCASHLIITREMAERVRKSGSQ